ncbi:hypothetical protein PTI98_010840 [Pleurotus ostreatus]|nr:hypothetical protein PTI98_010840 [Pleurotus ostreatus]
MLKPQRRLPTFASAPQLQVLESAFLSKNRLDEEDKYRLACETGLNPGWINDWFTRRRKKKRTNSPAKTNGETGKNKRRRVAGPDAGFPRICADASLDHQENTPPSAGIVPIGGLKMEFLRYMPVSSLPSSSRQSSISAGGTDSGISECSTPANEPNVLISNEASVDSLPSGGTLSSESPSTGLSGNTPALTPDLGSSELHDSSRSLSQSPSLGYIPATFPSFSAHPGTQPGDPKAHFEGTQNAPLSLPVIQPDPTVFDTGGSLDLSEEFRASSVFTQLTQNTILTPPRPDSAFNTHHSSQQFYPSRLCDLSYGLGFSSGGLQTHSSSMSLNGSFGPQASRPVPLSFRVRLSDLNAYHQAILELNLLRNSGNLNANEVASMVSSEPLPPSLRYLISFLLWLHTS